MCIMLAISTLIALASCGQPAESNEMTHSVTVSVPAARPFIALKKHKRHCGAAGSFIDSLDRGGWKWKKQSLRADGSSRQTYTRSGETLIVDVGPMEACTVH